MGKKKADKLVQGIGAVLGLVLLAAVMAAAVLPFYLLVRMTQHGFQSWKLQKRLRIRETGCWLDEGEKVQFKRELQQEATRLGANQTEEARLLGLIEMEHEKARQSGLSYNNDGLPRRTSEGAAIRDNIDHLKSRLRGLDLSIRQPTCRQPYETWDELNEVLVQRSKIKAAFLGWLVGAAFFYAAKQEGAPLNIWLALFVPAAFAGACYLIALWTSKNPAAARCPRPVYITLDNVDTPEMDLPLRRRTGLRLARVFTWLGLVVFSSFQGHLYGSAEASLYKEQVNRDAALAVEGDRETRETRAALHALLDPTKQVTDSEISPYSEAEKSSAAPASRQSWYRPVPGRTSDEAEKQFSTDERRNIELLASRRDSLLEKKGTQRALPVSEPLDPQRIATFDATRVRTEINSIYARYGVEFPSRDLQAWAEKQPGYVRVPGRTFDEVDLLLDSNDRSSIELLAARRTQLNRENE